MSEQKNTEVYAEPVQEKFFDFRDFGNLDNSEDAKFLIKSMDQMFSIETIKAIKNRAISLLELKPGNSVIEIGCGLGHDSEKMAEIVGTTGEVIASDSSKLMLEEAKRRSLNPNVKYCYGKAGQLEFENNRFDAVYADRLLVSQPNVSQVLNEFIRVLKHGGHICITDIDTGTAGMYPYLPELTDKLIARLQEIILNKHIGRELPYLFKSLGLSDIKIFPEAYIVRSLELVNTMINFSRMINDLIKLGRFTINQGKKLLHALEKADEQGDFLYFITLFTVVGMKK